MGSRILAGRYELLDKIGEGGMAVVFKARDRLLSRYVAIKILRPEYTKDRMFIESFRRESQIAAGLVHPNIVNVYDVGKEGNIYYIVMELIEGRPLSDIIKEEGPLDPHRAASIAEQVASALSMAHKHQLIHRDVKPHNIMITTEGVAKITDFGIAKAVTGGTLVGEQQEAVMGSVHYFSPEQARGAATDARADLYSVGVMLYEMLTGKLPFDANSAVSVAVMQLQADPKMPRQINPNIPVGLEEITMQAMQKDPNARYQSAAEMLQDIENFKLNPGIKFNYKYIVEDSARYRKPAQTAKKEAEDEYKSPVIPVLTGIATAFVLVAVVFVIIFIDASGILKKNNSEQVKLPNFVGQVYNDILESQKYDFEFYKEEKFSSEIAEGVVMEQNPKPDKMVYSDSRVKLVVSKGPERLMVPDFQNMTYTQYTQLLKQQGLAYVEMPIYDENTPVDIVCNTNPQPRQEVEIGDVIEVYYSLGPRTEDQVMRNFVNMPYVSAKSQLDSLGITIAEATKVDSNKPEGTIISQEPPYGTKLTKDTVVKFTISNGKAPESTVTLKIELPQSTQDVTLEVFLDNESIKAANVSLASQTSYSIKLTGSGTQKVTVTLNGRKYRDYKVNFKTEKSTVSKEYDVSWLTEASSEVSSEVSSEEEEVKPEG